MKTPPVKVDSHFPENFLSCRKNDSVIFLSNQVLELKMKGVSITELAKS